jgi:hypothetical protein
MTDSLFFAALTGRQMDYHRFVTGLRVWSGSCRHAVHLINEAYEYERCCRFEIPRAMFSVHMQIVELRFLDRRRNNPPTRILYLDRYQAESREQHTLRAQLRGAANGNAAARWSHQVPGTGVI